MLWLQITCTLIEINARSIAGQSEILQLHYKSYPTSLIKLGLKFNTSAKGIFIMQTLQNILALHKSIFWLYVLQNLFESISFIHLFIHSFIHLL